MTTIINLLTVEQAIDFERLGSIANHRLNFFAEMCADLANANKEWVTLEDDVASTSIPIAWELGSIDSLVEFNALMAFFQAFSEPDDKQESVEQGNMAIITALEKVFNVCFSNERRDIADNRLTNSYCLLLTLVERLNQLRTMLKDEKNLIENHISSEAILKIVRGFVNQAILKAKTC